MYFLPLSQHCYGIINSTNSRCEPAKYHYHKIGQPHEKQRHYGANYHFQLVAVNFPRCRHIVNIKWDKIMLITDQRKILQMSSSLFYLGSFSFMCAILKCITKFTLHVFLNIHQRYFSLYGKEEVYVYYLPWNYHQYYLVWLPPIRITNFWFCIKIFRNFHIKWVIELYLS